jgi:hypothetical protein
MYNSLILLDKLLLVKSNIGFAAVYDFILVKMLEVYWLQSIRTGIKESFIQSSNSHHYLLTVMVYFHVKGVSIGYKVDLF